MSALASTLQAFFTDRLRRERHASPQTVAAYRDTWRLLLGFGAKRIGKSPSALGFEDIDVPLVCAFLDHLERDRRNSVRTRNARLAAIHSLFRYAAFRHPEHADTIARVLAIMPKRFERSIVTFLTEPEVKALLATPNLTSWTGRRDHALLLVAVQTGLRISELIGLRRSDVHLGVGAHLICHGKGRKERITPLTIPVGDSAACVARRVERRADGLSVPDTNRQTTQSGRDRASHCASCDRRSYRLPDAGKETRYRSCAAPYRCHASSGSRHRSHGDCTVAGSRTSRHHGHLLARTSGHQGEGSRPGSDAPHQARSLSPLRRPPYLP